MEMTALLATLFATSAQASPEEIRAPQTLGDLEGLPAPEERDDGTWLPHPLDHEVNRRLLHYYELPRQCQTRIDALKDIHQHQMDGAAQLMEAYATEQIAKVLKEANKGHSTLEVVLYVAGATLLAGSLGVVVGSAGFF